jgi:hypothetical protein
MPKVTAFVRQLFPIAMRGESSYSDVAFQTTAFPGSTEFPGNQATFRRQGRLAACPRNPLADRKAWCENRRFRLLLKTEFGAVSQPCRLEPSLAIVPGTTPETARAGIDRKVLAVSLPRIPRQSGKPLRARTLSRARRLPIGRDAGHMNLLPGARPPAARALAAVRALAPLPGEA